mgnify:FL=1
MLRRRARKGIFTGRTQYNLLVHFPGTPDLLGKYVNVRLDTCKGFYYMEQEWRIKAPAEDLYIRFFDSVILTMNKKQYLAKRLLSLRDQ